MLPDELRQLFKDNGHIVNHRDEVDVAAAAWYLDLSVGYLKNMRGPRSKHKGPPYVDYRFGVRYPIVGLVQFQANRLRNRAA